MSASTEWKPPEFSIIGTSQWAVFSLPIVGRAESTSLLLGGTLQPATTTLLVLVRTYSVKKLRKND